MGVLLQGFYKMRPNLAVPSPADGDVRVRSWWDHLASQANDLRQAGFTAVWLPPPLKTSAGAKPGSDGYGPFDDYDIGSKNQMGSVATRFGSREQLVRCVAALRANDLDVYLDLVEHHRSGDRGNFVFRYRGADGTADIGRFPKDPLNFRPNVAQDPHLGGRPADDFEFGRELCPINAKPPRYVFDNLIAAADWLTRTLDVQGYRLDDVKGLSTDFLLPFLNARAMAGKFAVGEFFDGNRLLVNGWIFNPQGMQGRPNAFDFPLKFLLTAMCNGAGRFNMADLDHAGLTGISPFNSVTFVENHDTDLDNNAVVFNKMLGYAYILTSEGYPCVYYRDYSTDENCYGLKPFIDNLIWIHEKLAAGPTRERWKDFNVFAYERLAGPHLLVGLNNDPDNARTITVATDFGGNVSVHDYSGNAADLTTQGDGSLSLTIPRNADGHGYVCYSRQGFGGGFGAPAQRVMQVFAGAADLDILPALPGKSVPVQRVFCQAGTEIRASLAPDTAHFSAATRLTLKLSAPDGQSLATKVYSANAAHEGELVAHAVSTGFHQLELEAAQTPAQNSKPSYEVTVKYGAPQRFALEAPPVEDPAKKGQWGPLFGLPNVAIHAHLLPNGKVLFWGRREKPDGDLDVHSCTPQIWDPQTRQVTATQKPKALNGDTVNLFCSGHSFLPDGRLLVIGGHWKDSEGLNQACIYDFAKDTWQATAAMNEGRWYPTAVTLPDGSVLASSGSFRDQQQNKVVNNDQQQIWKDGDWHSIVNFVGLPLFPRMHVAPSGRVFMSGTLARSFFLQTQDPTSWAPASTRANGQRDYAPSVMYDVGKVLYVGGGNDQETGLPTQAAEVIDLNAADPAWHPTGAMHVARRQHNATILADGSVLVTGGTRHNGFNNLEAGQPVHTAEIWDPVTGIWTELAAEDVDRCYHATALLLPDATVLSAGGGEYRPTGADVPNPPKDSHRDAQLFSPPYLFKGPRPALSTAPPEVKYGQQFDVQTADAARIGRVTLIRLGSVTHSFDQNQRLNVLQFVVGAGKLTLTAPLNANVCPPGHYLLFLVSQAGVPSVAKIVRIDALVVGAAIARRALPLQQPKQPLQAFTRDAAILAESKGTRVTVGITPTCPYGLAACWGGAYEALKALSGVEAVRPIANMPDSTAEVYLRDLSLPDPDAWREQFGKVANGTYLFRGVEITVRGTVQWTNRGLVVQGTEHRPPVSLAPLQAADRVQWDHPHGALWPIEPGEQFAYDELSERVQAAANERLEATITGPLKAAAGGFVLQVRRVELG